jgi:hypothetical protein
MRATSSRSSSSPIAREQIAFRRCRPAQQDRPGRRAALARIEQRLRGINGTAE